MPGVQKPHWLAPVAQKASAQRVPIGGVEAVEGGDRAPATRRAGVTQATRGAPSTSTVQQPHWPWGLQPSLAERRPEPVPQHLEQRGPVVGHLDLGAVDLELEAADRGGSLHRLRIGSRSRR